MARRLRDLKIQEISLVDMPANMRRFAIIKRQMEEKMDALKKLIESFTGKELDAATVAKAAIGEDVEKALEAQLQLIGKYRDDLPPAVVAAIGALSCQAAFGLAKADDKGGGKGKDDKGVSVEEFVEDVVEKAGKRFSKDTQKVLEGVVSKIDELNTAIGALKELMGGPKKDEQKVEDEATPEDVEKMIQARLKAAGFSDD